MNGRDILATVKRDQFVARRRKLLRAVAGEMLSSAAALAKLEALYERQTIEFLGVKGTTYRQWLEYGSRPVLVETRSAWLDDALWDRLVDKAVSS